jgi:uncharacterized membrane protein YgaE (UPF0421/DUF939 family)
MDGSRDSGALELILTQRTLGPTMSHRRTVRDAVEHGAQRTIADIWPLFQGTAAATAAWVIARYGFDHHQPFFAPIAAFVGLNTTLGQRGLNVLRLLQGVVVGIAVGEVTLLTIGGGTAPLALSMLLATAIARAVGAARIAVAQSAVGAILVVALSDAQAGFDRMSDALIGAGVALLFTQLLFSPEPLALLRRAELAALRGMAEGLSMLARALERDDHDLAERALAGLRDLPHRLAELSAMRHASTSVARRSLWRTRRALVVRENENADHLDLLGGSCILLARFAPALSIEDSHAIQPSVRELADVLALLGGGLGDRAARQRSADRAFEVARSISGDGAAADSTLAHAITAVRMVATDIMVFAGVDLDDAVEAVRAGVLEQEVRPPASARPGPLSRLRDRRPRGRESS